MSRTTANPALTTLWNMSSPLHLVVIENSMADAELALQELWRAGFQCEPQIVDTRAAFLDCLSRFACDIVLADYRLDPATAIVVFPAGRRPSQKARALSDYLEQALAIAEEARA